MTTEEREILAQNTSVRGLVITFRGRPCQFDDDKTLMLDIMRAFANTRLVYTLRELLCQWHRPFERSKQNINPRPRDTRGQMLPRFERVTNFLLFTCDDLGSFYRLPINLNSMTRLLYPHSRVKLHLKYRRLKIFIHSLTRVSSDYTIDFLTF